MKEIGIVRNVDDLGRIVLPIEVRKRLGIDIKDSLEILIRGDEIILRKHQPLCCLCGGAERLLDYRGKKVCMKCIGEMFGETGRQGFDRGY